MSSLKPEPNVIAMVGMSLYGQDADIVRGVAHYAQHRNWRLQLCGSAPHEIEELGRNFRVKGLIAHVNNPETAKQLRGFGVPVINISGHTPMDHDFPFVVHEMDLAGQMAADYFWQRGYRNFVIEPAPLRFQDLYVSLGGIGFTRRLHAYGAKVYELTESLAYTRSGTTDPAAEPYPLCSLKNLPLPAAIFVVGDRLAARICGMCQDEGLSVPEEVAVLGFGNFELVCETAYPPLSSIQTHDGELGRQAAALLYNCMKGNPPATREHLVPPLGIVTRRSSDALSIEDRTVAKAVNYIRTADLRGITCDDVALHSGINRRTLERKFRQVLGRSLYTEIQTWRCDRARTLLQTTQLPLKFVAVEAGFRDADHMGKVLKAHLGQSPKTLRT